MSKTGLGARLSLIKMSVPLAPGMLLTDTFKAAGRGAMILDALPLATESAERTTYAIPEAEQRRPAMPRAR